MQIHGERLEVGSEERNSTRVKPSTGPVTALASSRGFLIGEIRRC